MIELTDEVLIKQIQAGNDEAFEHLLHRYKVLIDKIVRKYYLLGYESEDFFQVASLAFYRAILTYDNEENATFYTYALSCVRNRLVSLCRHELVKKEYVVGIQAISVIAEAREKYAIEKSLIIEEEQDTILHNYRAELNKFLAKENFFGEVEKLCLNDVLEGLTYPEISQKYGFDHTKISNAMARIRSKLKKHGFNDDLE